MNSEARKLSSRSTTRTTRPSLDFTVWLRALSRTPRRRRRCAAALLSMMCRDSDWRALPPMFASRGRGWGGPLLAAAARRCLRAASEVGGVILIIDAKNQRAARWYASYGAMALRNKPLTLVMCLATFAADLKAAGQL